MKYLIYTFFLICVSCSSQKKKTVTEQSQTKTNSELTLLLRDSYGGGEEPQILVIKEPKSLAQFFNGVNSTRKPGLAIPKIDFEKEMVLVVCSGEIKVNKVPALHMVENKKSKMVLEVSEESTLANDQATNITTPFCIYKMPLSNTEISFQHN